MRLYGLHNSNRDFELPSCWKKNIFNNAYPVGLAAWMHDHGLPYVYLTLSPTLQTIKQTLTFPETFGLEPDDPNLYHKFESDFPIYAAIAEQQLPKIDLVTFNRGGQRNEPLRSIEIKLTALPDHTTADRSPDSYGCEIVIRPDSVAYLALAVANIYLRERDMLYDLLAPACKAIDDWSDEDEMLPHLSQIRDALNQVMLKRLDRQQPLVLQPIWRTVRQRLLLADQCFDIFVWSDMAFAQLFMRQSLDHNRINRPARSFVWVARMLWDFANTEKFNPQSITNNLVYSYRNDKAFSMSGAVTQPIMACPELVNPRVPKTVVREIILGGGQDHLQPERRLDAAILTTPNLFPQIADQAAASEGEFEAAEDDDE